MSDNEDHDDAGARPGGLHVHANLAPIMDIFTERIGHLVRAMQEQTFTLAEQSTRSSGSYRASTSDPIQQQQADFVARQEELFRRQGEALETLVRNVTADRPRDIFREVPTFSGNPDDFTEWVASVNRVREACQVTNEVAIAECASKLVDSAREWHERVGVVQNTWAGWQALFRCTLAPIMTMLQWYTEAERRQLP